MLEKEIISAQDKEEFEKKTKKYFVNMYENARTLHVTNNKSCPHSKFAYSFLTFSTMDEVLEFERKNKNATPFRRCGRCF